MNTRKNNLAAVAAAAAALLAVACGPSPREQWGRRVEELPDVTRFARLGGEETFYHSSSDPSGDNADYNRFVRPSATPGWAVLAEFDGPGVLDRFWMTGVDNGYGMRVYADGADEPLLEGAVEDLWGGTRDPWTGPLSRQLNQCWWSYVPIPFAESLRIEGELPPVHRFWGPRRLYVQAEGRRVERAAAPPVGKGLPPGVLEKTAAALDEAMRPEPPPGAAWGADDWRTVPDGGDAVLWEAGGDGTLAGWTLCVEPDGEATAGERQAMLHDLILDVRYGADAPPSVSVPLGDFFCNGWRKRNFACLAMRSGDDGYECRLPMPFRPGTALRLLNRSGRPVRAAFRAGAARERGADEGFLHAVWNKSGPDAGRPHRLAEIGGRGKYVGCYLGVTSLDGSWWILEGDETVVADGRRRCGTGMEDYFNGGWYYRGDSFTPWSGILDRCPFRVGQYRFLLSDPVPFGRSFSMDVERGNRNVSRGWMRSVAWFYLAEPAAVPDASARTDRAAEENPQDGESLMVRLFELERCRDWRACAAAIGEWLEGNPGSPYGGVLKLRLLESERMADPAAFEARLAAGENPYAPFLAGEEGDAAKESAELLERVRSEPGLHLLGCANHAAVRVAVDGKTEETRSHPLKLFVRPVRLAPGRHRLDVTATPRPGEPSPWVQAGLLGKEGIVAATGPGCAVLRGDGRRQAVIPQDTLRGPPHDETYRGAEPNAFVLLQSAAFGVRALDWDAERDRCVFSVDFETPGDGVPPHARAVTGLPGPR